MTKWLTEAEQHTWRLWVQVTQRAFSAFEEDLQSTADLTMSDYEVLVTLSESPDHEARMSDLADRAIISRSRLTYRIDRLVKKGYIIRAGAGTDRRGVVAKLTDEGMAHLVAAAPSHVATVQRVLFERLSDDDVAALTNILTKLADPVTE